jgi:hypothetical protein
VAYLTELWWDALALNHHLGALRRLGRAAVLLAEDVFKCDAALVLDDESVEVEGVDLEVPLAQHLHNLAVAAHLLHALLLQQQLRDAFEVAMANRFSQLALLDAAGDKNVGGGCERGHERLGLKAQAPHPSGFLFEVELLLPARFVMWIVK